MSLQSTVHRPADLGRQPQRLRRTARRLLLIAVLGVVGVGLLAPAAVGGAALTIAAFVLSGLSAAAYAWSLSLEEAPPRRRDR